MEKERPRILFLWPPELPYDLTLHYHYTLLGETAAYFANKPDFQVDVFDGGVLAHLKKEYIQRVLERYDYMAIYTQVQNTHSSVRAAEICKEISPETRIVAYGPSCLYVPRFFKQEPFSGYVWGGDPELSIESYIKLSQGSIGENELTGFAVSGKEPTRNPAYLDPEDWAFPPLDKLPLEAYDRLVQKKTIKQFGDRQISLTASRGCPYDCDFCFASLMFGKKERRRPVGKLIDFIEHNRNQFNSLQFFSPNFTLNKKWVYDFCEELLAKSFRVNWRCTTRAELLDREIVGIMARAGCESIGIGIETLNQTVQQNIHKTQDPQEILGTIKMIREAGVNPKAYIMLGLPGQTREDIYETIRVLQSVGADIRPSSYSPYQELGENSTLADIAEMNRYTHRIDSVPGLSPVDYLNIIFNRDYTEHGSQA